MITTHHLVVEPHISGDLAGLDVSFEPYSGDAVDSVWPADDLRRQVILWISKAPEGDLGV